MKAQFELHMKGNAAQWFTTEEDMLQSYTWQEMKEAFLLRFKPSRQSVAIDLSKIFQKADETVQQFAERFCKMQAHFPLKCEKIKVAEFTEKL